MKVGGGGEMNRKKTKKKGRPSLLDLRIRNLHNSNNDDSPISVSDTPDLGRRSTRRNPNPHSQSSDSDDEHRKKKKLKLVQRLPASNSTSHASDSDEINSSSHRSTCPDDDVVVHDEKVTEALQGSPLEIGPTPPLPDKKLLVFILDRLQKKDTYGVFSEPVDPDELPDYHEIIKNPMDFGTLRKKLDDGSFSNLDDFESDVLLICTNAMQYNAPDTVYYRQAKSILEIAKRDFQNLRQVNDEGKPQPRIVRRGRPPNSKKALNSPPLERRVPESSPDATLATSGDNNNNNNNNNDSAVAGSSYNNLRKGLPSAFLSAYPQSRNTEAYNYRTDWNSEFPAKILKAEAKHAKKQFSSDENRRATYKRFNPSAFGHDSSSSLATLNGNMKQKQLIGVGLYSEHGYARSLARFAANLGPVAWKIASKKIESALPSGVNFGPGWVGENEALPPHAQPSISPPNNHHHQSGQMSYNEQSILINNVTKMGSAPHLLHSRNGFNYVSGYDSSSGIQEAHPTVPNKSTLDSSTSASSSKSPRSMAPSTSEIVPPQQHRPYNSVAPVPPDLNMRFQEPGSSSSSFRMGSPQPDLALQL